MKMFYALLSSNLIVELMLNVCCFRSTIFGICNADSKSCPVHATYIPRTKWSFYEDVESLDKLILSLNERGLRESLLRTTLLQEKERIVEGLHKCPIHR